MVQGIPGAVLRQRARLLRAQEALSREFPALSAEEVLERYGSLSGALSIEQNGHIAYPAFQFGAEGVKAAVAEIQSLFGQKVTGWSLAIWFISANGWLDGARPVDLLDGQPEAVLAAAHHGAAEIL